MAVIWEQWPEHGELKARLKQAVREKHLAHGLLFSGPNEDFNRRLALGLAQLLVCETETPCGECGPCRRVELEASESLHWLRAEGNVIKIEPIRELKERLALAAWSGPRVVVLEPAHQLNPQAANALLKSLEEPPEQTYFILLSTHERALLPTIRSRVQILRVPAPALALNWGSAEMAQASFELWNRVGNGQKGRGFEGLKELFSSRDQALETVRIWAELFHRARRWSVDRPLPSGEGEATMVLLAKNPGALDRCWRGLINLKIEIEGQVERGLAVDSFLAHAERAFQ